MSTEADLQQLFDLNREAGLGAERSHRLWACPVFILKQRLELMPQGDWEHRPQQSAELFLLAVEVAYLCKQYEPMEEWLGRLLCAFDLIKPDDSGACHPAAGLHRSEPAGGSGEYFDGVSAVGFKFPDNPGNLDVMKSLVQTKLTLRGKTADLMAMPP